MDDTRSSDEPRDHDPRANDRGSGPTGRSEGRSDDRRGRVGRGVDRGLGAFTAFREALGETVTDARERGDLTTDRAKELLSRAVGRARHATADARDRFDFAPQAEVEALRQRVEELERRLGIGVDEPAPHDGEKVGED